jgi:DNA-binding NarL/FixJ family response regulator
MQPTLTRTERQVALLVVWGGTNKQIAELLDLDTRTVERELERVCRKVGVESRGEPRCEFDAVRGSVDRRGLRRALGG